MAVQRRAQTAIIFSLMSFYAEGKHGKEAVNEICRAECMLRRTGNWSEFLMVMQCGQGPWGSCNAILANQCRPQLLSAPANLRPPAPAPTSRLVIAVNKPQESPLQCKFDKALQISSYYLVRN